VQEVLVDRRQLFLQRLVQLGYDLRITAHPPPPIAARRSWRIPQSYDDCALTLND
jgi:hypothetical protein